MTAMTGERATGSEAGTTERLAATPAPDDATGRHGDLDGVRVWYLEAGDGPPAVLAHGEDDHFVPRVGGPGRGADPRSRGATPAVLWPLAPAGATGTNELLGNFPG